MDENDCCVIVSKNNPRYKGLDLYYQHRADPCWVHELEAASVFIHPDVARDVVKHLPAASTAHSMPQVMRATVRQVSQTVLEEI